MTFAVSGNDALTQLRERGMQGVLVHELKAWQVRVRQDARVHMHFSVLGTTRESWNGLAGIEQSGRIESRLHGEECGALAVGELHAHGVYFFDPNAMLARDRATEPHAKLEDLGTEAIRAVPLARSIGIEQDQRVQVAIAGVKDIHAPQRVAFLHALDSLQ